MFFYACYGSKNRYLWLWTTTPDNGKKTFMNLFYVLLCLLWFKKPIFMVVDDNARQRQKNFYEPLLCSFMPVMVQKTDIYGCGRQRPTTAKKLL
jgi:hypothetical protein